MSDLNTIPVTVNYVITAINNSGTTVDITASFSHTETGSQNDYAFSFPSMVIAQGLTGLDLASQQAKVKKTLELLMEPDIISFASFVKSRMLAIQAGQALQVTLNDLNGLSGEVTVSDGI